MDDHLDTQTLVTASQVADVEVAPALHHRSKTRRFPRRAIQRGRMKTIVARRIASRVALPDGQAHALSRSGNLARVSDRARAKESANAPSSLSGPSLRRSNYPRSFSSSPLDRRRPPEPLGLRVAGWSPTNRPIAATSTGPEVVVHFRKGNGAFAPWPSESLVRVCQDRAIAVRQTNRQHQNRWESLRRGRDSNPRRHGRWRAVQHGFAGFFASGEGGRCGLVRWRAG